MVRSCVWPVVALLLIFSNNIFLDSTALCQPKLVPEKTFDLASQAVGILRSGEGMYYLLDPSGTAIKLMDSTMALLREIGGRGTADGRFRPPLFFTLGRESRLYVLDGGNKRIQVFNSRGDFLRSIPVPMRVKGRSIAVDQRENFYVLFAEESYLVTKYDSTGKVLTQFGLPIEREREKFARNEGYLVYDDLSGKLILSFMCAPIVKVFTTNGDQVWETKLQSKIVQEIESSECDTGAIGGRFFFNVYSSGVGVVDRTIWVMLSRGTKSNPALYGCDMNGNKIVELPILDPSGNPVRNVIAGCLSEQGDCAFIRDGNKILVSHINNKLPGGVR